MSLILVALIFTIIIQRMYTERTKDKKLES